MTATTEGHRTVHFLGNNEIDVLVSSDDTNGAYCVLAMTIQPRGGATTLHTDDWIEAFQVIDGQVEWTLERDGKLVTWIAGPGETVVAPVGTKHKFVGAGDTPTHMLAVGPGRFEQFFRALSAAWSGPYDRERTPSAIGPVFDEYGVRMCAA